MTKEFPAGNFLQCDWYLDPGISLGTNLVISLPGIYDNSTMGPEVSQKYQSNWFRGTLYIDDQCAICGVRSLQDLHNSRNDVVFQLAENNNL